MKRVRLNNLYESHYLPNNTNVLWVDKDEDNNRIRAIHEYNKSKGEWQPYLVSVEYLQDSDNSSNSQQAVYTYYSTDGKVRTSKLGIDHGDEVEDIGILVQICIPNATIPENMIGKPYAMNQYLTTSGTLSGTPYVDYSGLTVFTKDGNTNSASASMVEAGVLGVNIPQSNKVLIVLVNTQDQFISGQDIIIDGQQINSETSIATNDYEQAKAKIMYIKSLKVYENEQNPL